MDFTTLWAFGYRDLVCVVPPGAPLHEDSALRPEDLGKCPGRPSGGVWAGYNWRTHVPTWCQVEWWQDQGANVGLQTAKWPAVDVDVEDPAMAAAIGLEAVLTLGAAPCRTRGESPKRLLLYSTTTPMGKAKITFELDGKRHAVEVLGAGQQFVAGGMHPSGNLYTWDREPDPIDLVRVGPEDIAALFDGIEQLVAERGGSIVSRTDRNATSDAVRAAADLIGDSAALATVVAQMPNEGGWDELQDMAYALKAALGDEGLPILLEWAARWTGGDADDAVIEALWARCVPPFRIGANWIMDKAAELGVETASIEFADVPLPPAPPAAPKETAAPQRWSDLHVAYETARRAAAADQPFAFVPELGQFLVWDGRRWAEDTTGIVMGWVMHTCQDMAAALRMVDETKTGVAQARSLCGGRTIASVHKLLGVVPGVARQLADFDANDWTLNTPNGNIDLKTGQLLPHLPERGDTFMAAASPSSAGCPKWLQFVDEVTGGQADYALYLQKLAGYALTGATDEQMLAFLYGPGGNGKSVFVNTLGAIMGTYAKTSGMDVFLASRNERHKTEVARLAGARLVTAEETEDGRRWDKARITAFTGGSPITARFMGKDFFEFIPKFKLLFCGNHRPETTSADDALKRRLHILPFTFKPTTVNQHLPQELEAEWGAILQWAVEGCLLWQSEGLRMPQVASAETEDYFETEDVFGAWVRERCVVDGSAFTPTRELFSDWELWAKGAGESVGSMKRLSQRLKQVAGTQYARREHGTIAGYAGIRLRRLDETPAVSDFEDNVVAFRK